MMTNSDRREQIAQRLKLQKIIEIHKHFDEDKDGYLNYTELSSLQSVTSKSKLHSQTSSSADNVISTKNLPSESKMSRKSYKVICTSLGCKANKGLDLKSLVLTYESGGGANIEEDYDNVFGIKRKETKKKEQLIEKSGFSEVQQGKSNNFEIPQGGTNGTVQNVQVATPFKPPLSNNITTEQNHQPTNHNLMDLLMKGENPKITRTRYKCLEPPSRMDFILPQEVSQEEGNQTLDKKMEDMQSREMKNFSLLESREVHDTMTVGQNKPRHATTRTINTEDMEDTSSHMVSYADLHKQEIESTKEEYRCLCTIS